MTQNLKFVLGTAKGKKLFSPTEPFIISQMTNFRFFQTERLVKIVSIYRRQNIHDSKFEICTGVLERVKNFSAPLSLLPFPK